MDIAISILVVLLLITQPVMLFGLSLIFIGMAVFSRPFRWRDLVASIAVLVVAVALIQWNGGWERISAESDPYAHMGE